MQGENDIEQLAIVLRNLGTPSEESWPGLKDLPDYNKISFPPSAAVPLETLIPDADQLLLRLIRSFLLYDSKKRIPAKEVRFVYFVIKDI